MSGQAIYVLWHGGVGQPGLVFSRSLDGGVTWSAPFRIATNPPIASAKSRWVMGASGDAVFVIWEDGRDGLKDIYFRGSLDKGATWQPTEVRLDIGTPDGAVVSERPTVAVTGSSIYVAWEDERNGWDEEDALLNVSRDMGATWLASPIQLSQRNVGVDDLADPTVRVDGAQVFVCWSMDGGVYLNRSTDGGTTWLTSQERIDDGSAAAILAAFQVGSGRVFAAMNKSGQLFWNRSLDSGVSWLGSDLCLDDNGQVFTQEKPQMAATADAAYVALVDRRNVFAGDVYFNIPFGLLGCGNGLAGTGGVVLELRGSGVALSGSSVSVDLTSARGQAAGTWLVGGAGGKAQLPLLGGIVLVTPLFALPLLANGVAMSPGVEFWID